MSVCSRAFSYKEDITGRVNAANVTRMILIVRKQQHYEQQHHLNTLNTLDSVTDAPQQEPCNQWWKKVHQTKRKNIGYHHENVVINAQHTIYRNVFS